MCDTIRNEAISQPGVSAYDDASTPTFKKEQLTTWFIIFNKIIVTDPNNIKGL